MAMEIMVLPPPCQGHHAMPTMAAMLASPTPAHVWHPEPLRGCSSAVARAEHESGNTPAELHGGSVCIVVWISHGSTTDNADNGQRNEGPTEANCSLRCASWREPSGNRTSR
eukprot:133129-Alexandrium_andersonii.AAC.1